MMINYVSMGPFLFLDQENQFTVLNKEKQRDPFVRVIEYSHEKYQKYELVITSHSVIWYDVLISKLNHYPALHHKTFWKRR